MTFVMHTQHLAQVNRKIAHPTKTNASKEIALCTCHRKLIKSGVNVETHFCNIT